MRAVDEGGASASLVTARLAAARLVSAQRYVCRFLSPGRRIAFRAAFLLAFPIRTMWDLLRDLTYLGLYSLRPSKREKVRRKAGEALSSARLLTVDLIKVVAG